MFDKDTRDVIFGICLSLFVTAWFIVFLVKGRFILAFSLPLALEAYRVYKERKWFREMKNVRPKNK